MLSTVRVIAMRAARSSGSVRGLAIRRRTGIVGLEANDSAREDLIEAYGKILADVQAIPATAEYRKTVEATTNYRLAIVSGTDNWDEIEVKMGGQQVEQLLSVANSELELIPNYAEWKLWEDPPAADLEEY